MSKNIQLCYSSNNTYPVDRNNPQALAEFKRDNPNISGDFISAGTPFILRTGDNSSDDWRKVRPDLICPHNHMQSLPPQARRKLSIMDDMFGADNLQAIADMFQKDLLPIMRNESMGAMGASATALDSRLSNFAKAANKLQEALEEVRKGEKAKYPKAQMVKLEQHARALAKDFNSKFQAEINKYIGQIKGKKGAVYGDTNRGINKAKSAKSIKAIQFTSTAAFQNLRAFEKGANILGKKLIVLDAGVRAGHVHTDYLAGGNWQKRAAVETAGFGFATAAGLGAGQAVVSSATGLGIAMLATPVGWLVIIGSAVAVGFWAAKVGDGIGQGAAGYLYDKSSAISWFN